MTEDLSFADVAAYLGIGKYTERILQSNSHGELFHVSDYYAFYRMFKDAEKKDPKFDISFFGKWVDSMVDMAHKAWSRPESVFQHLPKLYNECFVKYISEEEPV